VEVLRSLAELELREGRSREALAAAQEGLTVLRRSPPGETDRGRFLAVEILALLAEAHRVLREEERARNAEEDLVATVRTALGPAGAASFGAGRMRVRAAVALERLGRTTEARRAFASALEAPLPERKWIEARIRRLDAGDRQEER
jgi:hypothetical protein